MRLIGLLLLVCAALLTALPMTREVVPFRIAIGSSDAMTMALFVLAAALAAELSALLRDR